MWKEKNKRNKRKGLENYQKTFCSLWQQFPDLNWDLYTNSVVFYELN